MRVCSLDSLVTINYCWLLLIVLFLNLTTTIDDGTDDCGNICNHICVSDVLGCACYHGYYLDADNVTCIGTIIMHAN